MISKFALLSNLLLASAALAVSFSRLGLGDRLARRDKIRQSQPLSHVASYAGLPPVVGNSNWGGVVLADSTGTFSIVGGTFTVPNVTGNDASSSVWVGIDGSSTCSQAILQTGIDFTITQNQVQYEAWYEWYPGPSIPFPNLYIGINSGDVITATVTADSTTSGVAVIENHTTNQIVYAYLQGNSSTALCLESAEWIVEDNLVGGVMGPLADFNSISFTNAFAIGPDGKKHTPSDSDAYIADIVQNNKVFTLVAINGDNITIQYIGNLIG